MDVKLPEQPYGFIYLTENMINHKKYIGKRIYDPRGDWKKYLGSGITLRHAINKYGRDNFTKTIIEDVYNKSDLNEREKYWISFYNAAKSSEFYNIAEGGDGGHLKTGYTEQQLRESEVKRIKSVKKGVVEKLSGEGSTSAKLKEKDVLEIIERLKHGDCRAEIARNYNVNAGTIQDIWAHRTWKYLTDGIDFPKADRGIFEKYITEPHLKSVNVYTMDMEYVGTYKSAREAGRALNVGYKLISRVCRGERNYTCGYIFKFV